MSANPATFARERGKCAGCGRDLTADEAHYYGASCETCERNQFFEQEQAETSGFSTPPEALQATAKQAATPATIRLVLPYPVSANRYWRSFVPRGASRAITCVSDEAKAYKQDVARLAALAGIRTPILGRVRVVIELYPHRPLDWAKRARKDPDGWADSVQCLDLDNARKVLNDALKNIAFEDDKWIKQDAGAICEPDEHGARVVVTITPIVRQAVAPGLFGPIA